MSDKDIVTFYNAMEPKDIDPDNTLVVNNQRVLLSFLLEAKNNYSGLLSDTDGVMFKQIANAAMNMFRHSREYKAMLSYLLDKYPKLSQCTVYEGFTDVELHHSPLTLYDMAILIMKRRIVKKLPFNTFIIAKELMDYHEKEMVGFIPVCKSVHKLIHAGEFKPYIDYIHGDWFGFLKEFRMHYNRETFYNFINKVERNKIAYDLSVDRLKKSSYDLKVSYMLETLTQEKLQAIKKIHKVSAIVIKQTEENDNGN